MLQGCSGVVPGCSGLFRGCSGVFRGVPGFTDTLLRVNFRRIDFVHRKKIVIFQSIYKNTFTQLKKGMRT